jgi:hypothetical protein
VKLLATGFLSAALALAQGNGSIDAPVLGMVFDADASAVRLLAGIPGAATLGGPLASGIATAAVAAHRGFAVAVQRGGAAVVVSAAGASPLPGARSGATQVIVSPSGTGAALYFPGGRLETFTGLPDAAHFHRAAQLDETPAAIALSDDGEVLLSLVRGRRGDTVYAHRDSGPQVFFQARRVAALSFLPGRQDALIADAASVRIIRPDLGQQPAGADPDGDVAAVAASPDGRSVFIASRSGRVTIHDLSNGTSASVTCACEPRTLAPLRGAAVFRLNDAGGGGPLWVLDATGAEPRISFVASSGESR